MSDPTKPPEPPGSPFPSGPPPQSPFPSGPPPGQNPYQQPDPYQQNPYAGNVPNVRESAGWKWSPLIGVTYNGFPVGLVVGIVILLAVYAGH